MKPASPTLLALLASRQFFSADLYAFALVGGGNLYYCSGEQDIVWNGITWSAGKSTGPYIDRKDNKAKCHWKVGIDVDTLVFDVIPGSATVLGDPFLSAVRQGQFDGAEMTLYRAFMPTYGDVAAGTVIMFVGRVVEIDAGRSLATFSINSHLELLNQNMPRNLYQPGCVNTLYDSGCTVNRNLFSATGTVGAGPGPGAFTLGTLSTFLPTGYFDHGSLVFTSGANSGLSRSVKSYYQGPPSTIYFTSPFPNTPAVGDAFTMYAGCDKSEGTCGAKFKNLNNFRGFPYIPDPSTAV